jgi:small GTP-binding protein domain
MATDVLTFALAGNPNAGKTTLFNALTGLRQKVANYPGVTVERKIGVWNADGEAVDLIDLPGLYSLDATSIDEQIAREVLSGESAGIVTPKVVIAVVDVTNLERNLYLVTQLLEQGSKVVVALTMVDVFESEGHRIDVAKFSKLIGQPVVEVDARAGRGLTELAQAAAELVKADPAGPIGLKADDADANPIFRRYAFISDVVQKVVHHNDLAAHRTTEKIDKILTHRVFGLLILLGILLVVFQAVFSWATVPMDLLDQGFGALGDAARTVLPEGILADLVADGIIAGVGGVLVFLPQILLLFLFISILEDSGYMARAAFARQVDERRWLAR